MNCDLNQLVNIHIFWAQINTDWLDLPPIQDAIVANEGLGWDSLLKMVHNPGGDWHPGWGVDLTDWWFFPTHLKNNMCVRQIGA